MAEGGEVRLRDGVLRVTPDEVAFEYSVFGVPVRRRYPAGSLAAAEVRRDVQWWIFALCLLLLSVGILHAVAVGMSGRSGLALPLTSGGVIVGMAILGVQMSMPAMVLHVDGKKVRLRATREQAAQAIELIRSAQGYAPRTHGAADGPSTRSFR